MYQRRMQIASALFALLLLPGLALADTIVKFGLDETEVHDFHFVNGTFSTNDDGAGGTTGDQDTNVNFVGFLEGVLSDIGEGASFTLADVTANGSATVDGNLVLQATMGGVFELYDVDNSLLLSGELGAGMLSGSTTATTGSFFNTDVAQFTGGSLLAHIPDNFTAGISLALAGISSGGVPGLVVDGDGNLGDFTADGDGVIDAVPEPATGALLLSGMLLGAIRRRKA